jgi:hypothetical protein
MNETRYTIESKKIGNYIIPCVKTRVFFSPKRLGAYCADNGSLWTSLNDGKSIFEDEQAALEKLEEIKKSLFGN